MNRKKKYKNLTNVIQAKKRSQTEWCSPIFFEENRIEAELLFFLGRPPLYFVFYTKLPSINEELIYIYIYSILFVSKVILIIMKHRGKAITIS